MASKRNLQRIAINSSANPVPVVTNPSTTAFMYIWEIILTVTAATNLTFNNAVLNGPVGALTGAFDMTGAGGSFTRIDGGSGSPWLIIDPGASFTITNSGSASVQGICQYSN